MGNERTAQQRSGSQAKSSISSHSENNSLSTRIRRSLPCLFGNEMDEPKVNPRSVLFICLGKSLFFFSIMMFLLVMLRETGLFIAFPPGIRSSFLAFGIIRGWWNVAQPLSAGRRGIWWMFCWEERVFRMHWNVFGVRIAHWAVRIAPSPPWNAHFPLRNAPETRSFPISGGLSSGWRFRHRVINVEKWSRHDCPGTFQRSNEAMRPLMLMSRAWPDDFFPRWRRIACRAYAWMGMQNGRLPQRRQGSAKCRWAKHFPLERAKTGRVFYRKGMSDRFINVSFYFGRHFIISRRRDKSEAYFFPVAVGRGKCLDICGGMFLVTNFFDICRQHLPVADCWSRLPTSRQRKGTAR